MSAQSDLHNKLSGEILRRIIEPVIESGGTRTQILVLTESIVAGVIEFCARKDGVSRDIVLDALVEGARERAGEDPTPARELEIVDAACTAAGVALGATFFSRINKTEEAIETLANVIIQTFAEGVMISAQSALKADDTSGDAQP